MQTYLGMDPHQAYIGYVSVTTTSAPLGTVIGGLITSCVGGYKSPLALPLTLIFGVLAFSFGFPIPYIKNPNVFAVFMWLQLFFGSCVLPAITGIMISAAPKSHRAVANSVAYISYNLLGYVPAPYLYGVLTKMGEEDGKSNYGCIMLMSMGVFSVIFISLAVFF